MVIPCVLHHLHYLALYQEYNHSCGTILNQCSLVDRKSTRLNSSHVSISYAVFCLKKKTQTIYYQNGFIVTLAVLFARALIYIVLLLFSLLLSVSSPFFYSHPPSTVIYTLSLHDALPISHLGKENGYSMCTASPSLSSVISGVQSFMWNYFKSMFPS